MADKPVAVATPAEVTAHRDSQVKEYGTYVALTNISFNGSLAYLAGDPVPASNVERYDYLKDNLVAKSDSKAAQDVVTAIHTKAATPTVVQVPDPVSLSTPVK